MAAYSYASTAEQYTLKMSVRWKQTRSSKPWFDSSQFVVAQREIWSDNGTNFTGAEKELRLSVQDLNEERIKSELHSREVEWYSCPLPKWRFQPPAASHMSGVWERLIRSVRKAMRAVYSVVRVR